MKPTAGPWPARWAWPPTSHFLTAVATGTISQGRFQADSHSGGTNPLSAAGAWTPQGGSAQGHIDLTASRWLTGYQKMLGPQAEFRIAGAKAADGFFNLTASANAANADLTAQGEADIGRQTTGPKGVAVTLVARSVAPFLGWPPMQGGRFAGAFTGQRDRWTLAGNVSLDAPAAFGYALARVQGPLKVVQKAGETTLTADLSGDGGRARASRRPCWAGGRTGRRS